MHGSTVVTAFGTVIDGWDIQGRLDIKADNVVVRNTRIRCSNNDGCLHNYGGHNLRVSRVDIGHDSGYGDIAIMDGGVSGGTATNAIYSGVNIHNVDDGVRCDGDFTVTGSWIHSLAMGTAAHSDGCQVSDTDANPDPGNVVFTGNVVEGGNTSCFIVQGNPSNVLIEDNMLLGVSAAGEQTSYAINVGASVPQGGVLFVNNVMNRNWQAGIDGSSSNYQWNSTTWSGNTYTDGTVATP